MALAKFLCHIPMVGSQVTIQFKTKLEYYEACTLYFEYIYKNFTLILPNYINGCFPDIFSLTPSK